MKPLRFFLLAVLSITIIDLGTARAQPPGGWWKKLTQSYRLQNQAIVPPQSVESIGPDYLAEIYGKRQRILTAQERGLLETSLKSGIYPVDGLDKEGYTGLMWAAMGSDVKTLQLLLLYGADVNLSATSDFGRTALHYAAARGNAELVQILFEARANLDSQDQNGDTPLVWALRNAGNLTPDAATQVSRKFVELRANINIAGQYGKTALMWSARHSFHATRILIRAGAAVDQKATGNEDRTALWYAAHWGEFSTVALLLAAGADSSLRDRQNRTGAEEAKRKGFLTTVLVINSFSRLQNGDLQTFIEEKSNLVEALGNDEFPEELKAFLRKRGTSLHYIETADQVKNQEKASQNATEISKKCVLCQEDFTVTIGDTVGKGPADCDCFLCSECTPQYIRNTLDNSGTDRMQCPGLDCKKVLSSQYFKRHGTDRDAEKIAKAVVEQNFSNNPNWVLCRTPDCGGGRIVREGDSSFHFCALCDFEGCLKCGSNHRGLCEQAEEENRAHQVLLEEGALPPPPEGHPMDPNHPEYNHGRWRECPHCKAPYEKVYDGTKENGQCNGMDCGNTKCGKKFHWNYGFHRDHPANKANGENSEIHDFELDYKHYGAYGRPVE